MTTKEVKKEPHQVFFEAYQKLCKKHGYQINVIPAYKARDDGTFSTVLQVSVSELVDTQQKYDINKLEQLNKRPCPLGTFTSSDWRAHVADIDHNVARSFDLTRRNTYGKEPIKFLLRPVGRWIGH